MKAVEFWWSCPSRPLKWLVMTGETETEALERRVALGDKCSPLKVRYDNGQLCTFKRKDKPNER